MWKTTCINPDTQMQSANEQKERARSYSNPVGFSHDSGVNVAHLRVHRLTNLHLNICQYWIWISFAYFNMKVTVPLCFTDGHSAGSWNVQLDFTHKWNFVILPADFILSTAFTNSKDYYMCQFQKVFCKCTDPIILTVIPPKYYCRNGVLIQSRVISGNYKLLSR